MKICFEFYDHVQNLFIGKERFYHKLSFCFFMQRRNNSAINKLLNLAHETYSKIDTILMIKILLICFSLQPKSKEIF